MKPINTFIIPTINNLEGLSKLVKSIYKYTEPDSFRIISVFNGTDEDFEKIRKEIGNKIHVWIKPYRNLGFGKSMNIGIQMATTEYVTLANDDVEVLYPSWWQDIMAIFADHANLGGFNPHSFINKRHTGDRAAQYDIKDEYSQEDIDKMKQIFHSERWYVGCCTFFTICKKAMFDKVGLFDESFGLGSGEDYDLCIRAAKGGYLIAGGSLVMVKHWWGATKDNLPQDENFISNYNLIMGGVQNLERKWGPHIDKTPDKTGWTVSGQGGPEEPFDKDTVLYPNNKWYQVKDL
jgi:GT2 family glycosyltransferase